MRRKERKERGKNFRYQVSGFRLQEQETGSGIRIWSQVQNADCRMQIADCRSKNQKIIICEEFCLNFNLGNN